MNFLEAHPLERGADEAQRALATLNALLAALPGDMQPVFQTDMIVFFCQLAARLAQLAESSSRWAPGRQGACLLAAGQGKQGRAWVGRPWQGRAPHGTAGLLPVFTLCQSGCTRRPVPGMWAAHACG